MRHRSVLRQRLTAALSLTVTTLVVATGLSATTASASAPEAPRPAFYEAPATLPSANGTVIRQETLRYFLDAANFAGKVADSRKVLYKSTNRSGNAIAVSGAVIVPRAAWTGSGPRPVIAVAPGTQGMADKCAPTRMFGELFEYEALSIAPLLARGYAVAITDYEGLGTAGLHTYMDRVSQGRALLDVARAAKKLTIGGITASSPVGVQGYSQGGGAAASAAELAGTYAPELNLKGALVGAAPANLNDVAQQVDGSLYASFLFFATAGLSSSYGLDLAPYLNPKGVAFINSIEQDCVLDLLSGSFKNSAQYTTSGKPLKELIKTGPLAGIINDQTLGRIKPNVPVLVTHSLSDDVIPYRTGRAMAVSWCGKGAKVKFLANGWPGHVGGMTAHVAESLPFWEGRFANRTFFSNCGWF